MNKYTKYAQIAHTTPIPKIEPHATGSVSRRSNIMFPALFINDKAIVANARQKTLIKIKVFL
jgi:hypothetical protein